MRLVVCTEPGVVAFNFMWAPTFIGLNNVMKKDLEKELSSCLVGKPMTDAVLDNAHEMAIDLLCEKFPIPGLRDYLDALKFVKDTP